MTGNSLTMKATGIKDSHWLWGNLKPFMQNPLSFLSDIGESGEFTKFRLFKTQAYHVSSPYLLKEVLANKEQAYIKNQHFTKRLDRLFGRGLLTAEGKHWKTLRKQSAPAFQPQSTNTYIPIINSEIDVLLERWKNESEINVLNEMSSITAQVIARCILGVDLNISNDEIEGLFSDLMDAVTDRLRAKINTPDWLPTTLNSKYRLAVSNLDKFIYTHVRDQLGSQGSEKVTLLWDLIQSAKQTGAFSERDIRDQVVTLFLAGHETTASTLAFAFILLSQNPTIKTKLLKEVDKIDISALENYSDIRKLLPFTIQCIYEVMRLYPPAYLFSRQSIAKTRLAGETIPKGSIIFIAPYVIHRNSEIFENPSEFNPDRWQGLEIDKYQYIPFSSGARTCIGEHLAMIEASLILARLLKVVDVSCGAKKIDVKPSITMRPANNLLAKITFRQR